MFVHLLEKSSIWQPKKDLPLPFLLIHQNHLHIKSITTKMSKIVTLNPTNTLNNVIWNAKIVLIIWATEQPITLIQSQKHPNNKNTSKIGTNKKIMNKKVTKIITFIIKTIKMIQVTIIILLKEIRNKDSIKETYWMKTQEVVDTLNTPDK